MATVFTASSARLSGRALRTAAAAVVLVAAQPCIVIAQDAPRLDARPTIAVMDFDNGALGRAADYENFGKGLSSMLGRELAANASIVVLERAKVQTTFAEQDLNRSDRVDQESAVRAGRTLGVHHMIFGVFIVDLRGRMRVDARVVNVETSVIEYTASKTDKAENMFEIVAELAAEMNKGMKLPPAPARTVPTSIPNAPDQARMQALRLFSAAQAQADRGNAREAVRLCREAVTLVPDYSAAKQLLSELEARGGERRQVVGSTMAGARGSQSSGP